MSDDPVSKALATLSDRIAVLESAVPGAPMSAKDQKHFFQAVARFIAEQIVPLPARIEALEARSVKGGHQRAMSYNVGDEVVADGSLWIAIAPVMPNETPGKSDRWQLAVKNGHAPERRLPTA